MTDWQTFATQELAGAAAEVDGETGRVQRFGTLEREYALLREGPALVDRNYAGVLEVTGGDRASWLHNLTTNQVRNLGSHEGVHAFALNVQGRVLFDLQVLNLGDRFWCVVNNSFIEKAIAHFDRYIITEDVAVTDRRQDLVRLGLSGERISRVLDRCGVGHAGAMASLSSATCSIAGAGVTVVRNDFCGAIAVDLFVPAEHAAGVWSELSDAGNEPSATPIGDAAVEVARIEAGLPCPLREIDEETLPAETGQYDRAVSRTKGCYLGQEIVERMKSRGVVARLLSGIRFEGEIIPPHKAAVQAADGSAIGTITSSCRSLSLGEPIALAYLKTGSCEHESKVRVTWDDDGTHREATGVVAALPFVGAPVH